MSSYPPKKYKLSSSDMAKVANVMADGNTQNQLSAWQNNITPTDNGYVPTTMITIGNRPYMCTPQYTGDEYTGVAGSGIVRTMKCIPASAMKIPELVCEPSPDNKGLNCGFPQTI